MNTSRLSLLATFTAIAVLLHVTYAQISTIHKPEQLTIVSSLADAHKELSIIKRPLASKIQKHKSTQVIVCYFELTCKESSKIQALFNLRWSPDSCFQFVLDRLLGTLEVQPRAVQIQVGYTLYSLACKLGRPITLAPDHLNLVSRAIADSDPLLATSFSHLSSRLENANAFTDQIALNLASHHESVSDSALMMAECTTGDSRVRLATIAIRDVIAADRSGLASQSALRFCTASNEKEIRVEALSRALDSRIPVVVMAALKADHLLANTELMKKVLRLRETTNSPDVARAIEELLRGN